MEPIDYTGALRRSWRLLLVLAVVGAVVAVLMPVSKPVKGLRPLPWQASALVGSIPAAKGSPLTGGVTSNQILFYATSNAVQKATIQATHGKSVPPYTYFRYLQANLVAPGTTSLKQTTASTVPLKRNSATEVLLTGFGTTESQAIATANTYAYVLQGAIGAAAQARAAAVAAAAAAAASSSSKPSSSNSTSDSGSGSTGQVNTGFVLQQPAQSATRSAAKTSLSSSRKVRLLAGLVIGALAGAAIVLLRELLDKRLRSASGPNPTSVSRWWWRFPPCR